MKKSYVKTATGMLAALCFLTGCGSKMPEMTEEQEKAIGEYAAAMLLQHDANNRSRLVDLSLEQNKMPEETAAEPEEETSEEEQTVSTDSSKEEVPVIEMQDNPKFESMETFFALPEGVSITYKGELICSSYPEENSGAGYFALDAAEGKKLLVLQFEISNSTEKDEEICLMNPGAVYKVTVNGESYNALTTMLLNDVTTYIDTLSAGETKEVVVLAEIASEKLESVSEMTLKVTIDAKTHTIQLK